MWRDPLLGFGAQARGDCSNSHVCVPYVELFPSVCLPCWAVSRSTPAFFLSSLFHWHLSPSSSSPAIGIERNRRYTTLDFGPRFHYSPSSFISTWYSLVCRIPTSQAEELVSPIPTQKDQSNCNDSTFVTLSKQKQKNNSGVSLLQRLLCWLWGSIYFCCFSL